MWIDLRLCASRRPFLLCVRFQVPRACLSNFARSHPPTLPLAPRAQLSGTSSSWLGSSAAKCANAEMLWPLQRGWDEMLLSVMPLFQMLESFTTAVLQRYNSVRREAQLGFSRVSEALRVPGSAKRDSSSKTLIISTNINSCLPVTITKKISIMDNLKSGNKGVRELVIVHCSVNPERASHLQS